MNMRITMNFTPVMVCITTLIIISSGNILEVGNHLYFLPLAAIYIWGVMVK